MRQPQTPKRQDHMAEVLAVTYLVLYVLMVGRVIRSSDAWTAAALVSSQVWLAASWASRRRQ